MRGWLRSILGFLMLLSGWALVLLGLLLFYVCFVFLVTEPPRYIAAGPLTLIGIMVFRGGIQLLKVGLAANICTQAQHEVKRRNQIRQESPRREQPAFDPEP